MFDLIFIRVSFYWGEAEPALGGKVPSKVTEELTGFRRFMKGTNQKWRAACQHEGVRAKLYHGNAMTFSVRIQVGKW